MIALRRRSTPYLLLAAAVCVAFGAALSASFHFDDFALFGDPYVTAPSGFWEVWRVEQTRPLTYFTFWLNHALGGQNPVGYHLFNLLIHLASVLLVYQVLSRMIPATAAFLAAALFAVHPIQTEPVVYIYALATLLMTLFCLLALAAWTRERHWRAVGWFALALLAKEECAAFPVFLLLLHLSSDRNRRELRAVGAMAGLALAAGFRVIHLLARTPDSGAGTGAVYSTGEYLLTQGVVILRYFRLFLVPHGFTVDPEIAIAEPWLGLVAWLALAGAAAVALRRFTGAQAGFWFLAGLVLLLPSSSIFPADDLAADRRLYLPLVAFAASAALLLQRVNPKLLGAVGVALILLTVGRVQVWQTEHSLWAEAVVRSPGKVRPRIQLSRASEPSEAIKLLNEAKTTAPDDAAVASELGRRWLETGKSAEALSEFGRALALEPGNPLAINNRGVALMTLGQVEAAMADFERALAIDPCLFDPRVNLLRLGVRTEIPARCRLTPKQLGELSAPF